MQITIQAEMFGQVGVGIGSLVGFGNRKICVAALIAKIEQAPCFDPFGWYVFGQHLVSGFFQEVLDRVTIAEVREGAEAAIAAELAGGLR